MNQLSQRDLQLHVTVVGWLHILGSALLLLLGAFLLLLMAGVGSVSGDPEAMKVLGIIGPALCFLLTGLALPGLAAGYGVLRRKPWGRVLALIVGILNLLNFPIGTAIGIYTIWVLMQQEATDYFANLKLA
jgi:hypothetical protein